MRTVLVVPPKVKRNFSVESLQIKRNDDATSAFRLECADEAFDDGNRAVLSDGTYRCSRIFDNKPRQF
jgi:hypothetical protein